MALRPTTYCVPRLEIEPSMVAALAVRWQTSRARRLVKRASLACAMRERVWAIFSSERRFRKGDCSSWEARPWRSAPSKTGSPVVLLKSARTMVSLSVSLAEECERQRKAPAAAMTNAAVAIKSTRLRLGAEGTGWGADPVSAATAAPERRDAESEAGLAASDGCRCDSD